MEQKSFTLGARLEACAALVRRGKIPADIGTDHAYLPIWLVEHGAVPRAFASDINEEPIQSARRNISVHGLNEKITTFTANGLEKVPQNEVDDVIIAGMGGDNIAAILNGANWLKNPRYRLILQPMSRASRLREYLMRNGFGILTETAVCEAGRVYTVICAEYSGQGVSYSEFDIYAGKLDNSDPNASVLLMKQAAILRSAADGRSAQGDMEASEHYMQLAEQLEEFARGGKRDGDGTSQRCLSAD